MFADFSVVSQQVLMLFFLIGAGYLLARCKLVTEEGARQMTHILLTLVTPAIMIHAFEMPFDASRLAGLGLTAVIAVAVHMLGLLVGRPFFRKEPEDRRCVFRFSVIYSNCGYMALPLIQAVVGQEGLFYGVIYVVVFNIILWTQGVILMDKGQKAVSAKKVFINPGVLGAAAALMIFFFSIRLPAPLHDAVGMVADLNTPLAMLIIGAFLARADIRAALANRKIYLAAALRLVLIPLTLIAAVFWLDLPVALYKTCVISASAPSAAVTTLFAVRYGKDAGLAGQLVALTTLCSLATMPLFVTLAGQLAT